MSHKRKGDFKTPKDEWMTPDPLFKQLDKMFPFELDAAANDQNHKCDQYFTKENSALTQPWGKKNTFLNPPYSSGNIDNFMKKALIEGNRMDDGQYVVCLIPVASDTGWWHNYVMQAKEIRFIKGRVKFVGYDENGDLIRNSPTFSSCICIFSGWHEHYWNQDHTGGLLPLIGPTIYQSPFTMPKVTSF